METVHWSIVGPRTGMWYISSTGFQSSYRRSLHRSKYRKEIFWHYGDFLAEFPSKPTLIETYYFNDSTRNCKTMTYLMIIMMQLHIKQIKTLYVVFTLNLLASKFRFHHGNGHDHMAQPWWIFDGEFNPSIYIPWVHCRDYANQYTNIPWIQHGLV